MRSVLFKIACVSGGLAVVFGAVAAHALKSSLEQKYLEAFEVGVRYHLTHSLILLAVCMSDRVWQSRRTCLACLLWLAGIALFSGSLYLLAITQVKWLAYITPFGGLSLIAGWFTLVSVAWTLKSNP